MRGIGDYCRNHEPWILLRRPPLYLEEKESILGELLNCGIDGIITRMPEHITKITSRRIPVILARSLKQHSKIPMIVSDSEAIGKLGADHFLHRGFKHFAFCGYDDMPWSQIRKRNFSEKITASGFKVFTFDQSKAAAKHSRNKELYLLGEWLISLPKPVGLMTCSDDCSKDVLEICQLEGIKVPFEVAILGVDDDDLICNLPYIHLSSIKLNYQRAGYEAAKLLNSLMNGEKMCGQRIDIHPLDVVERQSTDITVIEDNEVSRAIQFIDQNARKAIQVADVVNATLLSRRNLYIRFKKAVGHSLYSEIRRSRAKEVARALLDTNMSVTQIAQSLDFWGVDHISRFFRKAAGMSPLAYRKKYKN